MDHRQTCSRCLTLTEGFCVFDSALNPFHTLSHFRACVFASVYKPNKSLTYCLMSPGNEQWPSPLANSSNDIKACSSIPLPCLSARKSRCYFQPAVAGQPSISPKSPPMAIFDMTDEFLDDLWAWGNPQISSESLRHIRMSGVVVWSGVFCCIEFCKN